MTFDQCLSALIRIVKEETSSESATSRVDAIVDEYFVSLPGNKVEEMGRLARALGDATLGLSSPLVSLIQNHIVGIR